MTDITAPGISIAKDKMLSTLTPAELANWLTLYAATGVCVSLAAAGAIIVVGHEVIHDREWRTLGSIRAKALFVPQLWWRWQKAYLTGTPVILAIVGFYATSLNW